MNNDDYNLNAQMGGIVTDLICGLLGVAFTILKLCGVINWSWIWVLAPFWMPFVISLLIVTIIMIIIQKKR